MLVGDLRIVAVLALLDLIPALNEVLHDIKHRGAAERHVNLHTDVRSGMDR